MSNVDPSSAYRQLGAMLRRVREEAGLTVAELARGLDWSIATISRMENAKRLSTVPDVIQYAVKCGLTLITAKPLIELTKIAESKQGYYLSDARVGGALQSLIFHESAAEHSIIYEPQVVPGLLQTPNYARAYITAIDPDITEEWMARTIRTREERQRILSLPNPARFTFYIHEQALRLPVGTDDLMVEQLLHIVLTAALDNVTVRIVPSAAGERSMLGGAFRLMEFSEYRPIVYLDNLAGGGLILEDSHYVRSYSDRLPKLADVALDEGHSRECVAELADAYDRGSQGVVADVLAKEQLQRH